MNSERCSQCKHFIIANAGEGKIYGCDRSKCVFEPTTKNDLAHNLCDSCTNIGCEFQSGIVRTKCAFYMPPHIEPDNCGNYVVQGSTTKNDLGVDCISRSEVLHILCDYDSMNERSLMVQEIMELPIVTPQEPNIITCKECKYYRDKGNKYSYCTKRLNVDSVTDRYREPNFYCADAVLRGVEK